MARYFVIKRNNSEEMHIVPDDYEIIPNNIISGGFIALGEGEEFFCYSDTSSNIKSREIDSKIANEMMHR